MGAYPNFSICGKSKWLALETEDKIFVAIAATCVAARGRISRALVRPPDNGRVGP